VTAGRDLTQRTPQGASCPKRFLPSKLSRRTLVTSAAALPALAVPAAVSASVSSDDPIFAAIERHRQAITPWEAAVEIESNMFDSDPGYAEAEEVAAEKSCDLHEASVDLIRIYPTTAAGVAALLKYYAEKISFLTLVSYAAGAGAYKARRVAAYWDSCWTQSVA
jgi:hypothetical protein